MASITDASHAKAITTTDGTRYGYIYYPAQTGKDTVLLLHGFCSSVYDWRRVIPGLAKLGVGIIAPDLLGYGDTDAPDDLEPYRMKTMGGHVQEVVKHEGLAKVVGVGHDWGAGLLSHMWAFYPSMFLNLTFISLGYLPPGRVRFDAANATTKKKLGYEMFGYWPYFNSEEAVSEITANFETFQHLGMAADLTRLGPDFAALGALRKSLHKPKPALADWMSAEELAVHRNIIVNGRGVRGPLNWYKAMIRGINQADHDALAAANKTVKIPTLFIATAGDQICIPEMMRSFMRPCIAAWDDVELEDGHWVILSNAEKVVDAIRAFARL